MKKIAVFAIILSGLQLSSQVSVNTGIGNTSLGGTLHMPKKKSKEEKEEKKKQEAQEEKATTSTQDNKNQNTEEVRSSKEENKAPAPLKVYNNYDFIPGDKIIFEDDF